MSTAGRGGRGTSRGSAMRSSESAGVASPSLPLYALRASPMCVGKRVGRSGATAALRPGRWHRLMASCRWPFPLKPVYTGGKSFRALSNVGARQEQRGLCSGVRDLAGASPYGARRWPFPTAIYWLEIPQRGGHRPRPKPGAITYRVDFTEEGHPRPAPFPEHSLAKRSEHGA